MKKLISSFLALSVLLSLSSCRNKSTDDSSSSSEASQTTYSLKTADISMSDKFSRIHCLESIGDTVFVFGELSNGSYGGYTSDFEMKEFNGFSFEPDENEIVMSAAIADENTKVILTYKDGKTVIHRFNADGNEESAIECDDVLYDYMLYSKIIASDDGYYISVNNEYISYIDSSGNNRGEVSVGSKEIIGIAKNSKDMPIAILSENNNKTIIAELNGTSLNGETVCSDMSSTVLTACKGMGDYEISAVFYDALYGLKGTEWVKLCDFMDNNFGPYNISGIIMTAENTFIAAVNTFDGAVLKKMTPLDPSETVEQEVVKIAQLPGAHFDMHYIREYNSLHGKYKVEVVDYTTEESDEENIQNLKMDLITGNAPDLILYSPNVPIDSFGANSGVFTDLYTMIDSDPDLNREDFVDGILEGMESDGKLLLITPNFSLKTIECKDKFLDGLTSWNYEQMFEIYKKNRDESGIEFSAWSKYFGTFDGFMQFINFSEFVDYKNAKCSFDSENFIEILEFFKENVGDPNPTYQLGADTMINSLINDEVMIYHESVYSAANLHNFEKDYFGGESATIIGYPTENGSKHYIEIGGLNNSDNIFSIPANAACKEGAWDFIKTEYFNDNYLNTHSFPVLDEQLEKQCQYLKEDFKIAQNKGYDVTPMMDEQISEYISWVRENASNVIKRDYNVESIIYEEALDYFNSDISAEKTAERIQNRVSLYLSEQYT